LNFFEYGYVNRKSVPRNRKNDCSPGKKFRGEYSPFLFNGSMFLQLLYRHGTRLSSRSYYDRTICSFIGTTGRRHTFFFQSRPGSFLNSQYPSTYKLQVGQTMEAFILFCRCYELHRNEWYHTTVVWRPGRASFQNP
jgi:hypothetical protein